MLLLEHDAEYPLATEGDSVPDDETLPSEGSDTDVRRKDFEKLR